MNHGDVSSGVAPSSRMSKTAKVAAALGVASVILGLLASLPALICGIFAVTLCGLVKAQPRQSSQRMAGVALAFGVVGTVIGCIMLVPATARVQEARGRASDSLNIRRTYMGIYEHHKSNPGEHSAFVTGPNGQPNRGLSWRVGILPYIGQEPLHRQFRLNEAWDGAVNQTPAKSSVPHYLSAGDPADDHTRFRVFVGPGTVFEDTPDWRKSGSFEKLPDGASNTLVAVDTAERVPWASPKDIPYQPQGSLPNLGRPSQDTFLILMADGSARMAKKTIDPAVLHALITRNGAEPVPANWDR